MPKIVSLVALFLLGCLWLVPVSAATPEPDNLDWFNMIMWLAGGLAIFLYGMEQLIKSLLIVAGEKMKGLLTKLTTNRLMGALTGAGVTAVIQSSSVTTVLTVGFVSAGLMSLSQATGVILGTNLGTTVTAQVIAFKVTGLALLLVAVGFTIQFFAKRNKKIAYGRLILGLGLVFFGMDVMSQGMSPLREYQPFLDLMVEFQNPLLGILAGFIFTALIQSSSATIGIIIVMASNGFLTLPAGIALAMGANIGTTVTALLSTIGKSREAIRAGLIQFQFNVFGVLIFLPFIPELAQLASYISSQQIEANGATMELLAANTPREIANANTLFNLFNLFIFLPLVPFLIWVAVKLVPIDESEKDSGEMKAEYLDKSFISTPSLALQAVRLELVHYEGKNGLFYKRVVGLIAKPDIDKLAREDLNLNRFRHYQKEILAYLARVGQSELSPAEQEEFIQLMGVLHNMESMLGIIESNIIGVIHRLIDEDIKPSQTMIDLVGQLSSEVGKSIDNAITSVVKSDKDSALEVFSVKETINHLIKEALEHQAKRFKPTNERLAIFRFEMQLVEAFKQLHSLSKRIARLQVVTSDDSKLEDSNPDSEKVD